MNVKRVVAKVAISVLVLYVGGTVLNEIGNVMTFTQSPFYPGLTLIGWTVGDVPVWNSTHWAAQCANTSVGGTSAPGLTTTCLTDTTGSGILTVVGLIAIASVVMEFVQVSF